MGEAELKSRLSIVTAVLPCKDITPASLELYGILPLFYCPLKSTAFKLQCDLCTFIHLSAHH